MTGRALLTTLVCFALAVAALAVYWPVQQHEFVNFDDFEYIVNNPHVRPGLSAEGVGWAFTSAYRANWHPLTWLSHMLDVELWGTDAGAHHRTNLVLHAVNVLLLFAALYAMSGQRWPAALVAALWAVHPLHVESVAWASERKDVLSGMFWMLTLLAYAAYARRPGPRRYVPVAVAFALGLMAKQMLVTLPLVLLLLDAWPLRRWAPGDPATAGGYARWVPPRRLWLEKLPLFLLSAATVPVTVLSQKAGGSLYELPLAARLVNAPLSYVAYLWKAIWPVKLAVFYPHPFEARDGIDFPLIAGATVCAVALVAATFIAARARTRPYLLVGWLWYLGALVPVLGIVQVGRQGMADRYAYLTLIGIYIMVAWSLRGLVERRPGLRSPVVAVAVLGLLGLAVVARAQVSHWRDSESLFRHALKATVANPLAHNNLGAVLWQRGEVDGAVEQYEQALKVDPDFSDALANLGAVFVRRGDLTRAADYLERALERQPDHSHANYTMGYVLENQGRLDDAARHYEKTLAFEPGHLGALTNLGVLQARGGKLDGAAALFRRLLGLQPNDSPTLVNLGRLAQAYAQAGRTPEARELAREAIERARTAGRDDVVRQLKGGLAPLLEP